MQEQASGGPPIKTHIPKKWFHHQPVPPGSYLDLWHRLDQSRVGGGTWRPRSGVGPADRWGLGFRVDGLFLLPLLSWLQINPQVPLRVLPSAPRLLHCTRKGA